MSDIIHLLPDSIANQIAAGEVIQRPSSVVKELVENAIDAGADSIQIIIKDAGRTLIQVIDNGKGMSATDSRMAFERHATSKIKSADDLFALRTMGFRGEALPSIAAIAQIDLRTRTKEDELGTSLQISGSRVESQEYIACPIGSNFSVKNIFFNVPARRKFLKSNDTERRNILTELERIVLVNPEIEFSFIDNDIEVLRYPVSNLRQRIVNVVGKNFNQQLITLDIETSLAKIKGFVGKPESARKTRALQYFFVNGRYMRHPYFNKAVTSAFDPLIPSGESPNYFIYFEVEPDTIDVNIHPTKTEIKFENEQPIWQILSAAVKEALGKFNEVPTIDFDTADAIDIPIHDPSKNVGQPRVNINPSYNPFKGPTSGTNYQRPNHDWEQFYKGFEKDKGSLDVTEKHEDISLFNQPETLEQQQPSTVTDMVIHYQYKNKYILTSVKSGLMLIDQHRAHVRILFDQFLNQIRQKRGISQRALFPEIIELSPSEASMIPYLMEDLEAVGFDLSNLGNNAYAINGTPSEITNVNPVQLVHNMISKSVETGSDVKDEIQESLALSMANAAAIRYGHRLSDEEMNKIVDQLFASPAHKHTPDGRTIISLLEDDVIEKMFR
ncbi:DNA mismatch repair endonuclease MutL [Dysgonomonas sp. Marseille-P4677]|uniref:DNA mismatch repair endonuclease MutL n=1 Tax=Dysgonomonas sp. Marseille-P4677 TaxID=2364790 RepID=UPI00191304B9|nr:DNA mismatch repair endonuclease MutL [Dysgonomonas sp. Marseille-P4677]MBK5719630.1 DNA mismatch repair endonuclease MutL [Dysgonomonas sp. Marseille-P4677]